MISFVDSLNIWAAGDSGTVIQTSDGGITWHSQNTGILENIHHIFFLNKRLGWGLAWIVTKHNSVYGTRMIQTTNGGLNWSSKIFAQENVFLNSEIFLDSLNGWMGGYPGGLMKTTNGGINWNSVTVDSSVVGGFPIKSINFYNKRFGFACGGFMDLAGVIWRTTNYGVNWQATGESPEPIIKILFIDTANVIAVGGDFEFGPGMVRTRDGGDHWNYRTLELFGIPSSMASRIRNEIWIPMGAIPKFLFSPDSLTNFSEIETPDSARIYDIAFMNERIGFCVGDNGSLYKFNPNPVSVSNINSIIPSEFKLFQNYPNPFNPSTKIKYQIPVAGLVRIAIYDILGREIETLLNQYKPAGTFEAQWNASKYTSGVYYYKMYVNDFTSSKIMILVK